MPRLRTSTLYLFLGLLSAAILHGGVESQAENLQGPRVYRPIEAFIPVAVNHLNLIDPTADFLVRIDTNGNVVDLICVKATHFELIRRGTSMVQRGRYTPAKLDGNPIVADMRVTVYFRPREEDFFVDQFGFDHIARTMHDMHVNPPGQYQTSKADELDEPLEIVTQGEPWIPVTDDEEKVSGEVTVTAYVDHHGKVRMPRVTERIGHPEVEIAAINTILEWEFTPPRRNGEPTTVQVAFPFRFTK